MRVALVHDSLTEYGGSERVLQIALRLYPGADVFTSFTDPTVIKQFFPDLTPPRLHTFPSVMAGFATHSSLMQSVAPFLWKLFPLDPYDLVISILSHLMCNFVSVKGTHIQYIQTPSKNIFGMVERTPLQKLTHYDRYIIPRYTKALTSTPYILTNSHHVKRGMAKRFGISPSVLYPPVSIPTRLPKRNPKDYYLMVGRIDRNKHIELAIQACNTLRTPLKIVGRTNEPRYEQYLREIAGPTISFEGFLTDAEIVPLYQKAYGFLFTAKDEDFGIAPVEALAHGVPVIAYWGGGVKETMIPGKTGEVFTKHTAKSLAGCMKHFTPQKYPPRELYYLAKRYSEDRFIQELETYVKHAVQ